MEKEIKCHLCNGKAILKFEELKLDEGKIIIKDSPFYECIKCKEKFSTSEQMQELSNQINSKFVFKRPIINAGRSLAITLPSDLVNYYDLKKGEKIKLIPENRKEIRIAVE
ncbi:MAG: hypothetical protein ABIA76_05535 [Candidatus Diapherotrites archaeon]